MPASPSLAVLRFFGDLGQTQELGADAQVFSPGGFHVDFEPNLAVLQLEVNDATIGGEPRCFADTQNGGSFELSGHGPEPFLLGRVDKEDMAVATLLDVRKLADHERPAFQHLAGNRLFQSAAEGVLPQDADHNWVISGLEGLCWPLHVTCKVV